MGLRMVAAPSSVDLSAIEQQVADAKAVAEQAVSDAAAADAKAANARTMILNRDGTLATLSQTAAQFGSVTAAADATHQQLQNEITALQQQVANVATTPGPKGDAGSAGATGSAGAKGDTGPAGTPADMSRVAALETAVTALQALKVTVGYGVANLPASLAAGASGSVTVTLSRNMGSGTFSVGYGLSGGTTLLGNVVCTGVTGQTATTVTLGVRNNGLASVLNLNAATLSVVAARDA